MESSDAQDEPSWGHLLATLDMVRYHNTLLEAAIDTPRALGAMAHADAMDILKELDVLAGHRHRLLQGCLDATRGEHDIVP